MNKPAKEFLLLIFVALPYLYLSNIWGSLPERVPTHFDIQGNPNDWSDKSFFLWFPALIGLGNYFLMLVLPIIDPKKKLKQMGNTYYSIRMILGLFICGLTLFIIYSSSAGQAPTTKFIFFLIGFMFAVLGNYFQTIKPNYFIGIRTPWTLESEQVWKETHVLGGKLWMIGGVLIVIISLLKLNERVLLIGSASITGIIALIPIVYSYLRYKKIDHSPGL